jgi:hypothetical protein
LTAHLLQGLVLRKTNAHLFKQTSGVKGHGDIDSDDTARCFDYGAMLPGIASLLIVEDPLQPAAAIVVLNGGHAGSGD